MGRLRANKLTVLAAAAVVAGGVGVIAAPLAVGVEAGSSRQRLKAVRLPVPGSIAALDRCDFAWSPALLQTLHIYETQELAVYEVRRQQVPRDEAMEIAGRLGERPTEQELSALPAIASEGLPYEFARGDFTLRVYSDGNVTANWADRIPGSAEDGAAAKALPDQEVRSIAEQFGAESGLLSTDFEYEGVRPQLIRHSTEPETGAMREQVLGWSTVFVRHFNGLPAGHISIRVNGQAEVYSVVRNARNVAALGDYPMLSPEEARVALHSPTSRVAGIDPRGGDCTAVIEKIELSYYEGPAGWTTATLQPVYAFEGIAHYESGWTHEFTALVPAVRPEYIEPVVPPVPGG